MLEFLESIGAEIIEDNGFVVINNLSIANEYVIDIAKTARNSQALLDLM